MNELNAAIAYFEGVVRKSESVAVGFNPELTEQKQHFVVALEAMLNAIEVVPVVHSEWKHLGGDEFCCPGCGHVKTTEGSWEKPWDHYCPNCGVKIGGGEI